MEIQPDVIEFMKTWMRSESAGSGLEGVSIIDEDDGLHQPPWIFLEDAGWIRDAGVPAYLPFRLSLTCYGRTNREARRIYRAATDLLHNATNVLGSDGVGFWNAQDETGPQPGPEGRWPARSGVVAIYMPDRPLTFGS